MEKNKHIKCDKCGKYSTPNDLELIRIELEWNPIGQIVGHCPHCGEGTSFDNGTVYMSRE